MNDKRQINLQAFTCLEKQKFSIQLFVTDWLIECYTDFNSFGHFISVNVPTNVSPGLNLWPLGCDQFWPQGHDFNKLGRGQSMMLQTKFGNPGLYGLVEEDYFLIFTIYSQCKTCDPRGVANFDPRSMILTNLVEDPYMMFYTKYEQSRPSSFREEDFLNFTI